MTNLAEEHKVLSHKEFLEAYRYDVWRDLIVTEVDIKTFIALKVAEKSFNLLLKQAENKALKLRQDLRSIDQMLEEIRKWENMTPQERMKKDRERALIETEEGKIKEA